MTLDLATIAVTLGTVLLLSFIKGGFGGGFAIVGIPMLSLVMEPLVAGVLLAPVFVAMDAMALRYWSPTTWSKPDVKLLAPALCVGVAIGAALLDALSPDVIALFMGALGLVFAGRWFMGGGKAELRPRSVAKAFLAGTCSGVTTMVAHAGGIPLAMYLLTQGLSKSVYAGTTSIVFSIGNVIKLVPWFLLVPTTREIWTLAALCLPVIPIGLWLGWKLHGALDEKRLYLVCYTLLVLTSAKLVWSAVSDLATGAS